MSLRVRWLVIGLSLVAGNLGIEGCATAPEKVSGSEGLTGDPLTEKIDAPTEYPHPAGFGLTDLHVLFQRTGAPVPMDLANCDQSFQEQLIATPAIEEHIRLLREEVHKDPSHFHWCFYSKLFQLDEDLKTAQFIDEKQKIILKAYGFLTPLAQAMLKERGDPRYLQWAIERYRSLSEVVFYRAVRLAPKTAIEIEAALKPRPISTEEGPAEMPESKAEVDSQAKDSLDEVAVSTTSEAEDRKPASDPLP